MGLFAALKREFDYVSGMLRVFRAVKKVGAGSGVRVPDHIEATVDRFPDNPMALLDAGEISYRAIRSLSSWAIAGSISPSGSASPRSVW